MCAPRLAVALAAFAFVPLVLSDSAAAQQPATIPTTTAAGQRQPGDYPLGPDSLPQAGVPRAGSKGRS